MAREAAARLVVGGLAAVGLLLMGGRLVQLLWGGAALAGRRQTRPAGDEKGESPEPE
jgi:hypothetical protein